MTHYMPTGNDAHRSEENKTQKAKLQKNYGQTFVNNPDPAEYTTIVRFPFGIGLSLEVSSQYARPALKVNSSRTEVRQAVDISGIHLEIFQNHKYAVRRSESACRTRETAVAKTRRASASDEPTDDLDIELHCMAGPILQKKKLSQSGPDCLTWPLC